MRPLPHKQEEATAPFFLRPIGGFRIWLIFSNSFSGVSVCLFYFLFFCHSRMRLPYFNTFDCEKKVVKKTCFMTTKLKFFF